MPSVTQSALHCSRSILQLQYWMDVKRCDFGYRFGYRHQFALISASYAKLQVGRGSHGYSIKTFTLANMCIGFDRDLSNAKSKFRVQVRVQTSVRPNFGELR
jgi:hypothetical protein